MPRKTFEQLQSFSTACAVALLPLWICALIWFHDWVPLLWTMIVVYTMKSFSDSMAAQYRGEK